MRPDLGRLAGALRQAYDVLQVEAVVKYTDDYQAKYRIWAKEGRVHPLPRCVGWPEFHSKKFSSYEEMNAWKRELLLEVARKGGVRWTK